MNNFWLVFRKELTSCSRDPDVLIYAVLLPLVLYPLSAVFVNEASLWYSSMQEKNKETVYIRGSSPLATEIADGLRKDKHFNVVDDASGRGNKPAVAVVTVDPASSQISIEAHETSSHLGTISEQIEVQIRQARFKALKAELKKKGISADLLNVFTVQRQGLKKPRTTGATDSTIKQIFDKLIALLVIFMILMMTVIGGPASVCMMAEEHEKKTYLTTLLLPINRQIIVIAKFLTVTAICLGGAAFNLACLSMFIVFILASSLGHAVSIGKVYGDLYHLTVPNAAYYFGSALVFFERLRPYVQLPTVPEVLLLLLFFLTTGALLSAIYLCVAAYGKTVKSAQMLVSLPMILLMALPTVALIPGTQFNLKTALIPIANLLIMRKFDNPPLFPSVVALIEPIVLIVCILYFVRRKFESQVEGKRSQKGKTVKAA